MEMPFISVNQLIKCLLIDLVKPPVPLLLSSLKAKDI